MIDYTDVEWEHYRNNVVSANNPHANAAQRTRAIADLMPSRYPYEERFHNAMSIINWNDSGHVNPHH